MATTGKVAFAGACLLALVSITGCGSGYEGPRLYGLTGKITVNGQPPGGMYKVLLVSSDSTVTAPDLLVQEDGTYQAMTGFGGKGLSGAAAGKYKVVLQPLSAGEGAYGPGGGGGVPTLPPDLAAYASAESSPKEIEVGTSKNQVDITIP